MEYSKLVCVPNISEADQVVETYEDDTTSKFVISKQGKMFGKDIGPVHLKPRILWEGMSHPKACGERLKFDGIPFMLVGRRILDCQHGVDRHISAKAKYRARREADEIPCKKRKFADRGSKKFGCPAKIQMREILKFLEYKVSVNTRVVRKNCSKQLKTDLENDSDRVKYERKIYIELPEEKDHCNHAVGKESGKTQGIDKVLIRFVHAQVYGGIESLAEMRCRIELFVKDFLFKDKKLPPQTNRRYNPTDTDIRNHMYTAKKRISMMTQNEVEALRRINELIESSMNRQCYTTENASKGDAGNENWDRQIPEPRTECNEIVEVVEPLTIHLQVDEGTAEALVSECGDLLGAVRKELATIQDPNMLFRVSTELKSLLNIMKAKAESDPVEKNISSPDSGLKMSLLEELRKGLFSSKKTSFTHLDRVQLSDSDIEADCQVLDGDSDTEF